MRSIPRRSFLARSLAAAAGLALPAWARNGLAQPGESAPTPAAAFDSLRVERPSAPPDSLREGFPSVLLAAAGDTVLGYNLQDHFDAQLAAGQTREQLWPLYFACVRQLLDQADLSIVNLECGFTERGEKLAKNFNFRARPELVEILKHGGVDVVSLANNHIRDYGRAGVEDTIATLDRSGIRHFGAGRNLRVARRPCILERQGLRVGLLGYYFQAPPDMLEPAQIYATAKRWGAAGCYQNLDCIRAMVRADVEELIPRVDIAVPFFHWGKEGSYEVRDYQIELAHLCVDLGCKAVLGAHPHRLQGVELYRGAPIFYSLGNFVYGGIKEPSDRLSALARMRIGRAGSIEADLVPLHFTTWPERAFQPSVLDGVEREDALRRIAELSRSFPATLPQLATYLGDAQPVPGR
ncbi:MAG: CapA family protein [Candidatus Eisenbacteria bacterium]|uniref:CapA family protein n=1 Tax=Eiseniibacteriota bacterium TaxID=2212470 RepID=A0A849SVV7_UNCEI|nr:CapA family protein [Candidatus Eisenbacteria bacterium]